MDAFIWSPLYETGIASVDAQHRRLVEIINRLGQVLANADSIGADEVQQTFRQLGEYARTHFIDEEKLMRKRGIAPDVLEVHAGHHREFTQQVLTMWQARAGMSNPAAALHGFLSAWLSFHILGEDQSMARQLARIEAGMSPLQAAAREANNNDVSTVALLAALQNIYSVLALQNRDLALVNQDLEIKVQERSRELYHAEKMASIGQLAAGLAHEINNPLSFVNSNLGSLGRYVEQIMVLADLGAATPAGAGHADEINYSFLREDLQALLAESYEGVGRVRKIINDLKNFAHLDEALWQDADLLAGLESTLSIARHELSADIRIERDLSPLPLVRCMPAQINQVFLSLLINAAHAIHRDGVIHLGSGVADAQVWIEVADNGCGMDETTRARLFEPFFTTKPVGSGVGLGLAVTWDIVQKHGGSIDVRSNPGQGASFRIWLPIRGPESLPVAN